MKLIKISVLITLTASNVERRSSVLTLLSTKLQNTLVPNSLDRLMQLISMECHVYDSAMGEITDLKKFMKKPHTIVLTIHI